MMFADRRRRAVIADSAISRTERVRLAGVEQTIALDGRYAGTPIVVMLHGGPGTPLPFNVGMRGMFPSLTGRITAVYWDQYGCGINDGPLDESFDVDRFVDMTVDLVDHLHREFPGTPIGLMGTSWGSILAARTAVRRPDVIDRVMAQGQVLHDLTFNDDVYAALDRARLPRRVRDDLRRIRGERYPSNTDMTRVNRWIMRYTQGLMSRTDGGMDVRTIVRGLLTSPDYSLRTIPALLSNHASRCVRLLREATDLDLRDTLRRVGVPYLIVQGSKDLVTPTSMVERFVRESDNPNLSLRVLPDMSHVPGRKSMRTMEDLMIRFFAA
ncbi:alpha/beta fold hydrolase [Bifidobacterium simiarum]|uniref:alpha/beta fold hydrolase n=1 Tax=Bifidobacterium simiarum TaxID=2045441 RepID=UPI001BDC67A5|nr:alpha/beta fold hydrolase [Bifidobacterium simiarum]MBT1165195.1 alpha/beta fold hydrolase [Bifidobacterium simiarum]